MKNKLTNLLESERERLILWLPVLVAIGIAWYFSLKAEPPFWLGASLFIISSLSAFFVRKHPLFFYPLMIISLLAFGVVLAQIRTNLVSSVYLSEPIEFANVTGKILDIEPKPKGSKIVLRDVSIDKLTKEKTPKFISITLRDYNPDLVTGQIISIRAGLFPPPPPAFPNGFDFGRYFYFRQIGAVGYGIPPMQIKSLKDSGENDFSIWFSGFRHQLTEAMRSHFHEPAGSVAAAFITGETNTIPDEINDNMRVAGLYHLLAVSGMNLSVVAGLAFFSLRLLLAMIPPIALRFPIKKWAALLALIASYIYLRVSGTPVSAERAFFMVSLIFIAILLDRDPTPMRSVAFSAFCIELYEPEAVLTASFQLSYSATAALIASYEWGINYFSKQHKDKGFGLSKVFFYFAAVMATSLVAWLATEPFIIYHFNQFSSYSLIANTIAEPLVSFLLMPLVIAGVLLMPFGLSDIAFYPMQYGVDLLLYIAKWTASLPHAMWIMPNPSDNGFFFVIMGLLWIYFWKSLVRWLGVMSVVAGMLTAFSYLPPDIFISGDGKHIAAHLENGKMAMLKGRNNNINAQSWARAALTEEYVEKKEIPMDCDKAGCIIELKGKKIAVIKDDAALADECNLSDIIIAPTSKAEACKDKLLINQTMLENGGGVTIWINNGQISLKQTKLEQGKRAWVNGG